MHDHLLILTHITLTLQYIQDSIVFTASQKQWTQKETVQCCESSNSITTSLFVCCDHPGEWSSVLTEVGDSGSRNVPNTDNYTVEGHGRSARNACRGGLFFKMSLQNAIQLSMCLCFCLETPASTLYII